MKANDFILKKTNDSKYKYLLISTSMSRIDEYISRVEMELLSKKIVDTYVVLDLLLNNNIQDRFYQCYFNGKNLDVNRLKKINPEEINKKIVKTSSCFYINHMDLFDSLFFSEDFKSNLKKKLIESF